MEQTTMEPPAALDKKGRKHWKQWRMVADISETDATSVLGEWKTPDPAVLNSAAPPLKQIQVFYRGQRMFNPSVSQAGWTDKEKHLLNIGLREDHVVFYDSKMAEIKDWKAFYLSPLRAIGIVRVKAEADLIVPQLWLGDLECGENAEWVAATGITHVVRATKLKSQHVMHKNVEYLQCDIDDVDEENIIRFFPLSTAFISKAIAKGGKVLVHCLLGKSRSVSILAAYLLETQLKPNHNLPLEKSTAAAYATLTSIAAKRPAAGPTRGFVYQLALWAAMQFSLEGKSVHHRQYRILDHLAFRRFRTETSIDKLLYKVFPDTIVVAASAVDTKESSGNQLFRCAKCNNGLFNRSHKVSYPAPHSPAPQPVQPPAPSPAAASTSGSLAPPAGSPMRRSSGGDRGAVSPPCQPPADPVLKGKDEHGGGLGAHFCHSHMLEPTKWMVDGQDKIARNFESGPLHCPSCATEVGVFSWKPITCECGLFAPFYFCVFNSKTTDVKK